MLYDTQNHQSTTADHNKDKLILLDENLFKNIIEDSKRFIIFVFKDRT